MSVRPGFVLRLRSPAVGTAASLHPRRWSIRRWAYFRFSPKACSEATQTLIRRWQYDAGWIHLKTLNMIEEFRQSKRDTRVASVRAEMEETREAFRKRHLGFTGLISRYADNDIGVQPQQVRLVRVSTALACDQGFLETRGWQPTV